MSSYFPAPPAPPVIIPTRIIGPDGFPLTGDVSILPGNDQSITRAGQALTIQGAASKRARSLELFIPGAMTARTIGVFSGVPNAVLSAVDAYFKTAPGAGTDGSNFANLHIAGRTGTGAPGAGGPIDFPFSAQVAEWHLTGADLSTVVGANGLSAGSGNTSPGDNGMVQGHKFTMTANVTVGGIAFKGSSVTGYNGNIGTGPLRVGIASAFDETSGKRRSTIPWLTLSDGLTPAYVDVPYSQLAVIPAFTVFSFPYPISLVSGTTYSMIAANMDTTSAGVPGVVVDYAGSPGTTNMTIGSSSFKSNTADGPASDPRITQSNGVAGEPLFKLLGTVVGTPMSMPVTISTTITGAPANPGSDLVVSLQF